MPTPPPSCIPLDYYESIKALLATTAPTFFGAEHTSDAGRWPRYTWVPVSESASTNHPRHPNCLGAYKFVFAVHVYGTDFSHAYRMRNALLTALYEVAQGTCSADSCVWQQTYKGKDGVVCVQTVTITIPVWAQEYPETFDASGSGIVDDEPSTSQADHIASLTPSFEPETA